ncbi:MAG: hypothetical protein PHW62_06360 [Candidatus Ratteibacteria bacterium]|nr:hypothetical protein [Candidatus Ratteibacteria bacterium]
MNKWLNLPVGIALAASLLLIIFVPAIGLLGLIGTLIAAAVIYNLGREEGKTEKKK